MAVREFRGGGVMTGTPSENVAIPIFGASLRGRYHHLKLYVSWIVGALMWRLSW